MCIRDRTHLVDVLVDGRAGVALLIDAIQARPKHDGECEIRIARRIGHAELNPRRGTAAGRYAYEWTAIPRRPGNRRRRFISRDEALVRIHQWVGDGAECLRVTQKAANVVKTRTAQFAFALLIEKHVATAGEERLVRVHARPVDACLLYTSDAADERS